MHVQISYSVKVGDIPKELVKQLEKSVKISEKTTFILEQIKDIMEEESPSEKISSGEVVNSVEDLRQKLIDLDMNLQNISGILSSYEDIINPKPRTGPPIMPEPEEDSEEQDG